MLLDVKLENRIRHIGIRVSVLIFSDPGATRRSEVFDRVSENALAVAVHHFEIFENFGLGEVGDRRSRRLSP
jgi:hypothetical protein